MPAPAAEHLAKVSPWTTVRPSAASADSGLFPDVDGTTKLSGMGAVSSCGPVTAHRFGVPDDL